MRGRVLPIRRGVVVAVSFVLASFFFSTSAGASVDTQLAVGGGRAIAGGRDYTQFAFSALNSPHGASGHVTLLWPAAPGQPASERGLLLADVTCLVIVGNTATVIGEVTKSVNIDGPPNPDWVEVWAIDDSSIGDTDLNTFGYGELPCESTPLGVVPILSGNIVVRGG